MMQPRDAALVADQELNNSFRDRKQNVEKNIYKKPTVYTQNSHSFHIKDCLQVPKDTIIMFIANSGIESTIGNTKPLYDNEEVYEIFSRPIESKQDIDKMEVDLRKPNLFPTVTLHYSDYFGITPYNDTEKEPIPAKHYRKQGDLCRYLTTRESYYDIVYSEGDKYFGDIKPFGLTTLEEFIVINKIHSADIYNTEITQGTNF